MQKNTRNKKPGAAAKRKPSVSVAKKTKKTRAAAKKAKAARKAVPRPGREPRGEPAGNLEDLVVMNLMEQGARHPGNSMTVQDLVLSLTNSTRKLGYGFGFSVGKQINEYARGNINALFDALEKLGLGKVLYYPTLEHASITAIRHRSNSVVLGSPVHVIESGIIAGYLSGELGTGISVREVLCTYMDSDVCQFVAEPITRQEYSAAHANPALSNVVSAIAEMINSTASGTTERSEGAYYVALADMPLMKRQLLNESSNVLYLAGEKLARMRSSETYKDALRKIAYYFDLDGVDVHERSGKRVIRLRYKQYNSIDGLVELSSSMVAGFLETMFGSEPRKRSGIGGNRAYFVELTV
jgi:predicted hydrocarbon binding protein